MSATGMIAIGKITAAYGVKGWVKVHAYTEPMENFLGYTSCKLQRAGQWSAIEFETGRVHGKGLVAKIRGVDDRDAVEPFLRQEVYVETAELPALDDGDYYWHQLEGLRVRLASGDALLGVVDHLLATGANDVLVVKPCEGSLDQRERLIPYLPDQVVRSVDLAAGEMQVDWDPDF